MKLSREEQNEEWAQLGAGRVRSWNRFNYHIYKHVSWLPRRVNMWRYDGDAQWIRRVTLDLDMSQFERYADEFGLSRELSDSPILIPLFDVDKRLQFVSFDLEDEHGNALQLLPRSSAVVACLGVLEGAILSEHSGDDSLPPLDENPVLWEFLRRWLGSEDRPVDSCGESLGCENADDDAELLAAIYRMIAEVEAERQHDGSCDSIIRDQFDLYYERSAVFRYFIRLYSFKWLAFTRIELSGNACARSIKCRYGVPFDVFEDGYRGRWGFVPLAIELDDIRFGEVVHTTVCAPDGMRFVPARFYWKITKGGGTERRKLDKFFVGRKSFADGGNVREETGFYARGAMTSRELTLKTKAPWSADGADRIRPTTDDPEMQQYYLESVASPTMGMRTFGYTLFMILSIVLFVAIAIGLPEVFRPREVLSVGTLFTVVGVLTTFGASLERLSFARMRATSIPRLMIKFCVAIDAAGALLALLLVGASCDQLTSNVVWVIAVALCVVALIQVVWCVKQWRAQRYLDHLAAAYESEEISVLTLESSQA